MVCRSINPRMDESETALMSHNSCARGFMAAWVDADEQLSADTCFDQCCDAVMQMISVNFM
jgi:hypothetical protein